MTDGNSFEVSLSVRLTTKTLSVFQLYKVGITVDTLGGWALRVPMSFHPPDAQSDTALIAEDTPCRLNLAEVSSVCHLNGVVAILTDAVFSVLSPSYSRGVSATNCARDRLEMCARRAIGARGCLFDQPGRAFDGRLGKVSDARTVGLS